MSFAYRFHPMPDFFSQLSCNYIFNDEIKEKYSFIEIPGMQKYDGLKLNLQEIFDIQ